VELLLQLGAKVDASNNAGDRPWHWAKNMGHEEVVALLEKVGGSCMHGSSWAEGRWCMVGVWGQAVCLTYTSPSFLNPPPVHWG
jgi:hypothetical protein